jgi:hypothetical protein
MRRAAAGGAQHRRAADYPAAPGDGGRGHANLRLRHHLAAGRESGSGPEHRHLVVPCGFQLSGHARTAPAAETAPFNLGSFPVTIAPQETGYVGKAVLYHWAVSFGGDAYKPPVSNQCGERVVLGPTTLTITTSSRPGGSVGTTITDTATISGRFDPMNSGRVDFSLFSDSSCSARALVQDLGSASLGAPENWVGAVQDAEGAKPSVAQTRCGGASPRLRTSTTRRYRLP